uniref:Cingulin b n=1 Tax=Neolamprologus brichardi TaxID=32507 RepID=A0A3Q4HGS5_NEOBR
MSSLSADRKMPVDHGVQIRFIKDLHDTGGVYPDKSRGNNSAVTPSNKYGVAVRIQGISGQPYVVLKDGEKGDSYGVQLKTPTSSSGAPSPYNSLPKINKVPKEFLNPYTPADNSSQSPVSPAEDEDGEIFGRVNQTGSGFTGSLGRYRDKKPNPNSLSQSFPEPPASTNEEPVPVIDTNSLAPINKLISKFNSGTPGSAQQTRGRSGARQRLGFEERKRSTSLDARKVVEPEVSLPSPTLNPYASPQFTSSSIELKSQATPLQPSSLCLSLCCFLLVLPLVSSSPCVCVCVSVFHFLQKEGSDGSLKTGNLEELQEQIKLCVVLKQNSNLRMHKQTHHCTHLNVPFFSSLQDVAALQAQLAEATVLRQRLEDTLRQRERELTALKGALKEEVECHDKEMESLREQYSQDMEDLRKTMEQFTQVDASIEEERERVNASVLTLEQELESWRDQGEQWKTELEATTQELQTTKEELVSQTKLHSSMPRSPEDEDAVEALEDENRSLKSQLEEAKRGAARLSKERDELVRRLEDRDMEREALRRGKSELEEQKRQLDRAVEKLNKELMMGDSRHSVTNLQIQFDEYRERSRKDLLETQRSSKDRLAELQRAQTNLKGQQEEVRKDGSRNVQGGSFTCCLADTVEVGRSIQILISDRYFDKIKTLEIELDEEKSNVELLNDRISRSRDQVDQLRSELMQERSARHDLEMDKSALERQMKELKSRVADMEGQPRPSAGITLLETKIQELEEKLHSEEREKATIQASQRRTERKLKELNATLDQERSQHVEQRDQLTLRVKALKRQVDESELEVERLEGVRRKVLRDLEEQRELQEALHAKVTTLESELKRKSQQTHRSTLSSSALSSEDEDGFYDTTHTPPTAK